MSGKSRKTQHHHSNARRRQEAHNERQRELQERKRLRKQRAEIHAAMERATAIVNSGSVTEFIPPFRCAQKKDARGWAILDQNNDVVEWVESRDFSRVRRDELNADPPTSADRDEELHTLGFERNCENGRDKSVEQKFRKVSS